MSVILIRCTIISKVSTAKIQVGIHEINIKCKLMKHLYLPVISINHPEFKRHVIYNSAKCQVHLLDQGPLMPATDCLNSE